MANAAGRPRPINTFVFLDLESTGLPRYVERPRITEISLVAVQRSALLEKAPSNDSLLPRVVDKLTVCVCPGTGTLFTSEAEKISGLNSDNLIGQEDFDEDLLTTISLFLGRHSKPIALVAHNGVGFDFGLLKSEMENLDPASLSSMAELLCVDSLLLFKALDEARNAETGLSYKLSELHKRVVGYELPGAHRAENDSLALVRLFRKKGEKALYWADQNATLFVNTLPMYSPKQK